MSGETKNNTSNEAKTQMVKEIAKHLEKNYPKSKLRKPKNLSLEKIMIFNNEK